MDEQLNDTQITFTLGQGNHSSICGGVAPMRVEGVPDEIQPPESEERMTVAGDIPQPTGAK